MESEYDIKEDVPVDNKPEQKDEVEKETKEKPKRGRPAAKKAKEKPPKVRMCWVCIECGWSSSPDRSRLSCPSCGGPVKPVREDRVRDFVIANRRRKGYPS